ncbi:MAG: mucoidy inhibitor MuiA family protein [Hyphomicrobiales bacterium]|nr:mucoidy inhibitor MuiA family protein [Hyphomicrobiales bacterium]
MHRLHPAAIRSIPLAFGISMAAFCMALPALAADITASSKIEAVTVYPDAAQVLRTTEVTLPAGASSIQFTGLPVGLDPNSLRVEAAGSGGVAIGSVASRIVPAVTPPGKSALTDKLRDLVNERNLLNQKYQALRAKKRMIESFAKASPEKLGEKSSPMNVAEWDKAWNAVGEGLAKVAEEIQALQIRQREVGREIRTIQQSNRNRGSGSMPSRTVSVDVEASSGARMLVKLTYRIGGARWLPVYDARLDTRGSGGQPSLELIRRASVTQRTGEDWSGVALTVSTVRANRGTQAPDLRAQRLEFYTPPPSPPPSPAPLARAKREQAMRKYDQAMPRRSARVGGLLSMAKPAAEREARLDAGPYEAQFRIPGRVDVKADNSARVLRIASSKITPQLQVRAVPSMDSAAYLEASFENKDSAPLLPGVVNIHRDGSYAGRARFKLVAPGDKASLGLGADDSVRIKRVPVNRKQSGPGWIGSNRSEVSDFMTTVQNLHTFAIKVRIMDRLPISEDATIVIKPLRTNTTASQQKVDGKRGVMAWDFDLKPKATKEIRLGWQVEWPDGKRIVPRTLPN